jgi:uncharacterized protein
MQTYSADHHLQPVQQAERIKSVDMIRGFALLGILLMNIPGFGINWDAWYKILSAPHNTTDYYTLAVISTFFEGTMRGLFSMLFGAGMILFTMNKKEALNGPTVTEYYYRRLLWLVVFGLFNAYVLLWFGDILFYYGLCGMLLYVFRNTNPKWLLVLGFVCMAVTMLKFQLNWTETTDKRKAYNEAVAASKSGKQLSAEQEAAKSEWLEFEKRRKPDTTIMNRNVTKMRSSYTTIYQYWLPKNADSETWGMYHQWVWDGLTMMFIGMALFGWGFFSNRLSSSTYGMWLLVGYGIGIPISWFVFKAGAVEEIRNIGLYADRYYVTHNVLYDVRRILLSLGHASLLMLLFRSKLVPWLMRALANVGQLAFTNYLMQSIICTWLFYGYGFAWYNKLAFHQLYYVVAAVWIFQLIFSAIWLKYFRFGPFEWLWRSLTYWKRQPMKR